MLGDSVVGSCQSLDDYGSRELSVDTRLRKKKAIGRERQGEYDPFFFFGGRLKNYSKISESRRNRILSIVGLLR